MNDELERIREERSWLKSRYYPSFFLEGLRKDEENLGQESQCFHRDSNRVPHGCESETLSLK
jgi:hypothetical protein